MPASAITWRDRLRYRFENTLSKGTIAIIGWLALLSLVIIALAALLLAAMRVGQDPADHEHPYGFFEGMWQSMLRTLDPGVVAGDSGWQLRLLMLIVTIGGIFIVSILIGTITSGLESRLTEMRKGRSRVIEDGFTLILGWSSKVYSIIGELLIANENQKNPCIVILSERDKVEMEDDIRAKFPSTRNTRVICRSGNPLDLDDLAVVDPHSARSIIVLAPETENPDIHVIKSVLAITNNPARKQEPYHIVAEVRDPQESRGGGAGGWQGDHLRTGRGPHRTGDRPDLPPVRTVGGLHRAARLRWRRDLLQVGTRTRRPHVSRGDFGLRGFHGHGTHARQR